MARPRLTTKNQKGKEEKRKGRKKGKGGNTIASLRGRRDSV
jgi:hypothetical protein